MTVIALLNHSSTPILLSDMLISTKGDSSAVELRLNLILDLVGQVSAQINMRNPH